MHRFETINILSINILELNSYQEGNNWNHNLVPIEISKNEWDKVIDLLTYKNHYALIKKLNVFLGDRHKTLIFRRCSNSYISEIMLTLHKPKCENFDITTIRSSPESHLHWKGLFYKKPIFFSTYADFEADIEKDNSSVGNI